MAEPRVPPRPGWVLAVAIALPGMGQVLNGQNTRALTFIFFMLVLAWVSAHLATGGQSFVGRHAGGFFVYALSVLDAYRHARIAWTEHTWAQARKGP